MVCCETFIEKKLQHDTVADRVVLRDNDASFGCSAKYIFLGVEIYMGDCT